jgi:heat shock protein HtpX
MALVTTGIATYRWNNNIKSVLLLLAFPLLLLLLLWLLALIGGYLLADPTSHLVAPVVWQQTGQSYQIPATQPTLTPLDFASDLAIQGLPWVFGVAAVWMLIGYFFHGMMINGATGAHAVTRTEEPRLYNLLENLCISRGLQTPKLNVIETEALNAYASGISDRTYAVTVTRGLINRLDEPELEAVLAHELTHIINRDVRLLIITVVFVGMISFMAEMSWRSLRSGAFRSGGGRKGGGIILIFLIAAVLLAIGYGMALVLRFAISRRREYMADAGAVELTKNPNAMIAALEKISGNAHIPNVPPDVQQMFIENPPDRFSFLEMFATHPPIKDRIAALQELGGTARGGSIIPQV